MEKTQNVVLPDLIQAAEKKIEMTLDTDDRINKPANGFGDRVVRTVVDNSFEVGDTFKVYGTEGIFETVIKGANDVVTTAPFINVLVKDAKGAERVKRFFPSKLFQTVFGFTPVKGQTDPATGETPIVDYIFDKRYESEGAAADLMKSKATVAEGMAALAGKTIKVSKVTPVLARVYHNPEERKAKLLEDPDLYKKASEYHTVNVMKFDLV